MNCLLLVLAKRNQQELAMFLYFFNETIIPLALAGYEMVIADSARALRPSLAIRGIIVKHTRPPRLYVSHLSKQATKSVHQVSHWFSQSPYAKIPRT